MTEAHGVVCTSKGCFKFRTGAPRHFSSPPPRPPEPPDPLPELDPEEALEVLRRRAPHCVACGMIMKALGPDGEPKPVVSGWETVIPLAGVLRHVANEIEMSRSPEWVEAQRAEGTFGEGG